MSRKTDEDDGVILISSSDDEGGGRGLECNDCVINGEEDDCLLSNGGDLHADAISLDKELEEAMEVEDDDDDPDDVVITRVVVDVEADHKRRQVSFDRTFWCSNRPQCFD